MARRRVNNPLALAVLGSLLERPMHPYEISTTLRSRGKERSIKLNYGSLYAVVDNLQKHKLIEPRETVREGRRPERTVYAITPAGVEEFEDWLAELLSSPTKEYTSLEAGLSFVAGLPPSEVIRLLRERVNRLAMAIAGIEAEREVAAQYELPDLFMVEEDFRRAMLVAEREFVNRLADDIESNALSGVKGWRRVHELLAEGMTYEEILADPIRHLGEEARRFGMDEQPTQP
jgi:DNA-binding PadR family transcriptional regulator